MRDLWQPFAVHEQDEVLEQMGRTIAFAPEPLEAPKPHGEFQAYRDCGRGRTSAAPGPPRATAPACECLTVEEHLSKGCA